MRSSIIKLPARALGLAALTSAAVLLAASSALASGFIATAPTQVPDHPLATSPTCTQLVAQQTAKGSVNYAGAEVEPYVAADPANPLHLVASVQQDRWNDGGSNGLTNVYSMDGGVSWNLAATQPAFSTCSGATPGSVGDFNRATDPWVSLSSDGKIAYSISDSFNADGPAFGGASSIIASRSTDGGQNWQAPVRLEYDASPTSLNDKESITASSLEPKAAYAVWDRLVSPSAFANPSAFTHSIAFRGPALFSKTIDGGVTWSQGRVIFDPGEKNQTIGNQIVEPAAGPARGVLIDGFDLITTDGGKGKHASATYSVAVIRSTDGGSSWSAPIIVSPQVFANVSIAGHGVRSSDELPEFATDPTGNLYATWQDGRFSANGTAKIAMSMSTDGGLTWTAPIRVDQTVGDAPAFTPQIHAAADGTVAVTYYTLQGATAASPGLTDAYLAHCHSTCSTAGGWAVNGQTLLSNSGPFDMTTAPDAGGYFVGDYEGLTASVTASGNTFVPFYVMALPNSTKGSTDSFANQAH